MPLSQARALLSEGYFREWHRNDFEEASKSWLDLLLPYSNGIEPLDQHSAAIDLTAHPRSAQVEHAILDSLRRHYPEVRSGVGRAKWLAELAMEHGGDAIIDPCAFLASLPIAALTPVSASTREKLGQLGYSTIGQAQAIPYRVLQRQFGSEAQTLHQALHGRLNDPVRALYPPHSIAGFRSFEGGTSDLESVTAGCEALAADIGERLAAKERETTVLHLHVEHEDRVRTLSRTFSKPLRDPLTIRRALLTMIEGEIKEEVYGLRVTLPALTPSGRSQSSLFCGRAEDQARLEREISRVRTAFGDRALIAGSQLALPRRRLVLRELGGLVGWR
jgi:DNA polymerase-4